MAILLMKNIQFYEVFSNEVMEKNEYCCSA